MVIVCYLFHNFGWDFVVAPLWTCVTNNDVIVVVFFVRIVLVGFPHQDLKSQKEIKIYKWLPIFYDGWRVTCRFRQNNLHKNRALFFNKKFKTLEILTISSSSSMASSSLSPLEASAVAAAALAALASACLRAASGTWIGLDRVRRALAEEVARAQMTLHEFESTHSMETGAKSRSCVK